MSKKPDDFFKRNGGIVIDFRHYSADEAGYVCTVRKASRTALYIEAHPDLRMTHVRKYGVDVVFLSNEGEQTLSTVVETAVAAIWDSERGTRTAHTGGALQLMLEPRKSVHLILV